MQRRLLRCLIVCCAAGARGGGAMWLHLRQSETFGFPLVINTVNTVVAGHEAL